MTFQRLIARGLRRRRWKQSNAKPTADGVRTTSDADCETLLSAMRPTLRERLNSLFRIENLVLTDALPRTASNKTLRRALRENVTREMQQK